MAARQSFLSEELLRHLKLEDYSICKYEASLKNTPRHPEDAPEIARQREISWLNLTWFMQNLLDRMDRCSMASGLEARVPFADHRLLELLWNTPWSIKQPPGAPEKALLRAAGEGLLPKEILYRKKSPYPKSYHPAFFLALKERFWEILEDRNAPVQRYIDRTRARSFLQKDAGHGAPWYGQLCAGPQRIGFFLQLNSFLKQYKL